MLLLSGIMAFGFSVKVSADTRLDSMSADVRQVDDLDIIWMYPNKVLQYKDTVDFRLNNIQGAYSYETVWGQGYEEWGGILKDTGDAGVLGLYINRPLNYGTEYAGYEGYWNTTDNAGDNRFANYGLPWTTPWQLAGSSPYFPMPTNKFDLFWAKNVSAGDLGIQVNYADANPNNTGYWNGQNLTVSSQLIGINIGLGTTLGSFNQANFHLSGEVGGIDNEAIFHEAPAMSLKSNGIWQWQLGGLIQTDLSTDDVLKLALDLTADQFGWAAFTQSAGKGFEEADQNQAVTALVGNIAMNHKISGGKGLINAGLMLGWQGYSETDTAGDILQDDSWFVLANISAETPLTSWLTWRCGLMKPLIDWEYTNYGNGDHFVNDPTAHYAWGQRNYSVFSTGLGFTVENWTLDTQMSVQALDNLISDPSLGGVFYGTNTPAGNGYPIVEMVQADLKYKF